jgi:GT2 family glycosyltransferase
MTECQKSLSLLRSNDTIVVEVLRAFGSSSLYLRNLLAAKGNKKIHQVPDYDYYLSIDSDISFSMESIARLLQVFDGRPGAGIVSASYTNNGPNSHCLVAGNFKDAIPGNASPDLNIPAYESKVLSVDWVGAGFALIKKSVFEKLEYPWFRAHPIVVEETCELCTEDIGLCMDAKAVGFEILIDCSNRVGHCSQ